MLAADFYPGTPDTLVIYKIVDGHRLDRQVTHVSGKREARKLAKEAGATPWNF